MPLAHRSVLLAALLVAGCDSKVSTTVDPDLQKQLETIRDCFPQLFDKGVDLLALADTWRLNSGGSIPDPAGLSHSGDGPIDVQYVVDGCTIEMTIRFYRPAGVERQGLGLTATSLADRIDEAATLLRGELLDGNPFLVGDWTISGTKGGEAFSGSGAFTGVIGGSTNDNELERLRTTTAAPAGGPPPAAPGTLAVGACTLTFATDGAGLETDSFPTQEYPIGTVTVTIDGDDPDSDAEVTVTLTFDNTPVVQLVIAGTAGGRFLYNVETRVLTSAP
ncbi:MAG: hypothetical protein KF830_06310 [Planctomycetes bacterium]|nr:hypothetical protein [Planctomycetota bacterium]